MVQDGKMNIIYLDYGNNTANQMQTYFSVLSILAWVASPPHIHVLTDHVEAYQRLSGHVEVMELTHEMLQEWRGMYNYSFRVKIKAIQYAVQQVLANSESVSGFMFVDSDTFAFCELDSLFKEVADGVPYMHKNEGMVKRMRGDSRRMWQIVRGKTYASIPIEETTEMWNSGVIGIPASQAQEVCDLTLHLCDAMLADGVKCFNVEQFCFSIVLQYVCKRIQAAEPHICHYWGNKEGWCQRIADFFVRSYMEKHSLEQDIQCCKEMDFTSTPYYIRTPIWRRRFLRWTDAIAPLKRHLYLKR